MVVSFRPPAGTVWLALPWPAPTQYTWLMTLPPSAELKIPW
jgi:hypothetical protein